MLRDGVLMRLWCDRHRPSDIPTKQIVVPVSLRQLIYVAHDEVTSAHLGVNKSFFRPGINSDVRKYNCASCVICHRLSKSGERVRAPLINLPVIDEVWRKIAVDVVGPLERCEVTGCRFLVTI